MFFGELLTIAFYGTCSSHHKGQGLNCKNHINVYCFPILLESSEQIFALWRETGISFLHVVYRVMHSLQMFTYVRVLFLIESNVFGHRVQQFGWFLVHSKPLLNAVAKVLLTSQPLWLSMSVSYHLSSAMIVCVDIMSLRHRLDFQWVFQLYYSVVLLTYIQIQAKIDLKLLFSNRNGIFRRYILLFKSSHLILYYYSSPAAWHTRLDNCLSCHY